MKSIISFLVYTNIWVAFCVLGLALSTEILLGSTNFNISKFVFLCTIFTYNFQRVIRVNKEGKHPRGSWLEKNRRLVHFLMLFSGGGSFYIFLDFSGITQLVIILLGILCCLYPFTLRSIPFIKIVVIALVWSTTTMLLLILENNIVISSNEILHLVARFFFVFAITIPFDIRDLEYDTKNIITIPLFFGIRRSKLIASFLLFISILIAAFQYSTSSLILAHLLALILLYFIALVFVWKSDEKKKEMYFAFWGEGISICAYLFLVISLLIS